jgi:hypothetical protein
MAHRSQRKSMTTDPIPHPNLNFIMAIIIIIIENETVIPISLAYSF